MKNPATWAVTFALSWTPFLSLPAAANSIAVPSPCVVLIRPIPVRPPGVTPQNFPPPESQSERVKRILNEAREKRCVWESLQYYGEEDADLLQLKQIMLEDPDPRQRRFAAEALSAVNGRVKAVLAALSKEFDKEASVDVLDARLSGIAAQMERLSHGGWDETIDIGSLLESLAFSRSGHSTEEAQRILGDKAYLLARLVANISSIARSDDSPANPKVVKDLWGVANDELLRSLALWASSEDWIGPALNAFGDVMAEQGGGLDPQQQAALLLALQKTMNAQDDAVRANGARLMSGLSATRLNRVEAERIYVSSISAIKDASPLVRAHSVTLLGNLSQVRGADGADLVPALSDSSELVRTSAAKALLHLQNLPPSALPALSAMAKREGAEAMAAIEALALEGGDESMQVMTEVLTSKALRTGEEYYGETPIAVAIKVLGKRGAKAVVPLLDQAVKASDEDTQGRLYAALLNVGWPGVDVDPVAVERALTPAIVGTNEDARLFALSLLAMMPLRDGYRLPASMIDGLSERYLSEKPKSISKRTANPRDFPMSGVEAYAYFNETWRMSPQLAVGRIAGASDSNLAAERMVSWVCARHRMELAFVGKGYLTFGGSPLSVEVETSEAMAASLRRMGDVARPYIDSALAQKKKTVLCQRYLGPKNPA